MRWKYHQGAQKEGFDGTGLRTDLWNHRTNVARPVGMQSDTLNQQKYQTCADLAKAYHRVSCSGRTASNLSSAAFMMQALPMLEMSPVGRNVRKWAATVTLPAKIHYSCRLFCLRNHCKLRS